MYDRTYILIKHTNCMQAPSNNIIIEKIIPIRVYITIKKVELLYPIIKTLSRLELYMSQIFILNEFGSYFRDEEKIKTGLTIRGCENSK